MDEFKKYYLQAAKFLNYRPRSEKELREKLIEKAAPSDVIEKIVSKMTEQRFLNDEEFARMWIRSRTEFKPRSLWLIRSELMQKGISQEIVEKLLGEKDKKETDRSAAQMIVEKRIRKFTHLPKQEIYQKLGGFLARRGFDWDTIKRSIDEELQKKV